MSQTNNEYEPWLDHSAFNAAFESIAAHSLIDKLRLWELWNLVRQTESKPGMIVEVGVFNGGSLGLMALAAKSFGFHHSIVGFDTFQGCVRAGPNDPVYVGGENKTDMAEAQSVLDNLDIGDSVRLVQGEFPDSASSIALHSIALAHVDVDTYQSAKNCFEFIWPRVCIGGSVVFDDYGFNQCAGVTKYVNELWPFPDRVFIHNLNGHGILVRTK